MDTLACSRWSSPGNCWSLWRLAGSSRCSIRSTSLSTRRFRRRHECHRDRRKSEIRSHPYNNSGKSFYLARWFLLHLTCENSFIFICSAYYIYCINQYKRIKEFKRQIALTVALYLLKINRINLKIICKIWRKVRAIREFNWSKCAFEGLEIREEKSTVSGSKSFHTLPTRSANVKRASNLNRPTFFWLRGSPSLFHQATQLI